MAADESKRTPAWLEEPIRGLAFWLGYHHIRFRHHPLTEGAISGELIALIHASRPKELRLVPETMYSEIAGGSFGQTRADLIVGEFRRDESGEMRAVPEGVCAVVEVKRHAAWSRIEEDLNRLLRFLCCSRAAAPRAFLIVAYQARFPDNHFTEIHPKSGACIATRKALRLTTKEGLTGSARVRRVVRASSVRRESPDAASTTTHHVCLVEVLKA